MYFFNSLIRSWKFLIQCVTFFRSNKDLLFFPITSLILSLCLLFILFAGGILDFSQLHHFASNHPGFALLSFIALYFLFSFLIVYFNASLIACATLRLQGNAASVGDGLEIAAKRWWPLLQWSVLNTTAGLLIRILEHSHSVIEDLIAVLLGIAWTISTYFVIPIMVFENVGPFTAIKRGFSLFGRGWRRMLSIFLIFHFIALIIFLVLVAIHHFIPGHTFLLIETGLAIFLVFLLFSITIGSAFNGIVNSALYLTYAKNLEPLGFDKDLLQQAFAQR